MVIAQKSKFFLPPQLRHISLFVGISPMKFCKTLIIIKCMPSCVQWTLFTHLLPPANIENTDGLTIFDKRFPNNPCLMLQPHTVGVGHCWAYGSCAVHIIIVGAQFEAPIWPVYRRNSRSTYRLQFVVGICLQFLAMHLPIYTKLVYWTKKRVEARTCLHAIKERRVYLIGHHLPLIALIILWSKK